MSGNFKFTGLEFANYTLGQGGFNYIEDQKIHLAGPVPSFEITRLQKHPTGYTRIYFDTPNATFTANDDLVLSVPGLEEPLDPAFLPFNGTHNISFTNTTYCNLNLIPWPILDPAVVDIYPDYGHHWTASYIAGEGNLFYTYPDIEQWSVVQVIAKPTIGTPDLVLTNSKGITLTVAGTGNGVLNVTGVGFPGSWVKLESDNNKIIAYRG